MNKKVIGIKVVHTLELKHPIEIDTENPSKELREITDEIFDGVDNLTYELGHDYKNGVIRFIYEDEEL